MFGILLLIAAACTPTGGGTGTTTTTADSGPPVAVASASPTIGDAPYTVYFDSTGSIPGTGVGLTYAWDFGDGTPTVDSPSTSHGYATVGTFTAKLTMTNSAGTQ